MNKLSAFIFLLISTILHSQYAFAELQVIQMETPFTGSYVFKPNDGKPHPGIVMLHGSEGGSNKVGWAHASLLAGGGFSVLYFCWYDCGRNIMTSPQPVIENVDLEKTVSAIKWLRNSAHVGASQKIGLYGVSRGAEQALLLASMHDQLDVKFDAVAVHAPADITYGGYSNNWTDTRCWFCKPDDTACREDSKNWNPYCGKLFGEYKTKDDITVWRWKGKFLPKGERIPVERYPLPIFITCGDHDTVWPSEQTRRIEGALNKANRQPEVHMFAGEDHVFTIPAEQKRKALLDNYFHRLLDN